MARFGIDIWMTTTALADGFRVCQSFLGAKIHDPKDPGADLAAMLVQVVSAVFDLMETYHERWATVQGRGGVPLFGFPHGVGLEPVSVNVTRMLGIFAQGVRDLGDPWGRALAPGTLERRGRPRGGGRARASASPTRSGCGSSTTSRSRTGGACCRGSSSCGRWCPLYLGRTASFVLADRAERAEEVEAAIQGLADEFVRQKPTCATAGDEYLTRQRGGVRNDAERSHPNDTRGVRRPGARRSRPNLLAMLVVLLVGALAAGAVRFALALPAAPARGGPLRRAQRPRRRGPPGRPDAPTLPDHLPRRRRGWCSRSSSCWRSRRSTSGSRWTSSRGPSPGCPTSSWRWRSCSRAGSWPASRGAASSSRR